MKRRTLIGSAAAVSAALAAGLYRFTDLVVKHYAPTPYDDLLGALADREQAAKLGALVSQAPQTPDLAAKLRLSIKPNGLTVAAKADAASGRLTEVGGWMVPESVALLSALAAKV
jgi:hypothetical protein